MKTIEYIILEALKKPKNISELQNETGMNGKALCYYLNLLIQKNYVALKQNTYCAVIQNQKIDFSEVSIEAFDIFNQLKKSNYFHLQIKSIPPRELETLKDLYKNIARLLEYCDKNYNGYSSKDSQIILWGMGPLHSWTQTL